MKKTAFTLMFLAGISDAYADEYASHRGRIAFENKKCTEFVATMDAPSDSQGLEGAALSGLYFGILLGYDAAKGGLGKNGKTTLALLRQECANSPDLTARALIDRIAK